MDKSKIILLIVGLFVGFQSTAYCQSKSPRIIVGSSLGYTLPSGKFAATTILDEKAGFALQGYNLGFEGVFFMEKNFGFCSAIRFGSNPMDVKKIANGYAEILGGIFKVDAARWYRMDVFAGACITIPINKFHIDFKMMPGICNSAYPEIRSESSKYYFYQYSESTKSIGFCASGTMRYTISELFSLALFAETNRTKPTFNVNLEANGANETYTVDQPISLNTFGFSLLYNIY